MWLKTLKKILGVCLIILGVVGLFLPILQGVLLIFAGLLLLGFEKKKMVKQFKKAKKKIKFWR
ncbi:MAG: PGPGW domain-containing protein [Nanoarchaeota archaeon]